MSFQSLYDLQLMPVPTYKVPMAVPGAGGDRRSTPTGRSGALPLSTPWSAPPFHLLCIFSACLHAEAYQPDSAALVSRSRASSSAASHPVISEASRSAMSPLRCLLMLTAVLAACAAADARSVSLAWRMHAKLAEPLETARGGEIHMQMHYLTIVIPAGECGGRHAQLAASAWRTPGGTALPLNISTQPRKGMDPNVCSR
jgi:hypothetical protein